MLPSDFWAFARESVKSNWDINTFIDNIMLYITNRSLDEILKADLQNLYDYIQGVKI